MTFKMPPLPEPADKYYVAGIGTFDAYTEGQMHAYGRAVFEAVARRLDEKASTGRGAMHSVAAELRAVAKEQQI